MIGRVWHGWTSRENADAYESLLRTTIFPGIHRVPGFRGAHLLRRDGPTESAFVTLTWFASQDAVRDFAGPDAEAAVISDAAHALLDRGDARATHYALVVAPTTRTLTARYERWLAFERDAHATALASLATVPDAARADPRFAQAVELLAHVGAVRLEWLHRIGARDAAPATTLPRGLTLDDAARLLDEAHAAWAAQLATLDDAALARAAAYRTTDGEPFRNTVEDVLTQLLTHSPHHRGQVALLVRALGGEPAVAEFVLWSREPVEADA
jgi:uncharacterized damage-inducible protein DinB/heme-degrading monooxygenase HmoA